jgi:hypothetical protein
MWNTAANWSPNGIPGSSDTVSIPHGATVIAENNTAVNSTNHGSINVEAGTSLTISETVDNTGTITAEGGGATLLLSPGLGDGTATLTGSGVVDLEDSNIDNQNSNIGLATLTNQNNTIEGYGTVTANINLINNGTINANVNGQTLEIASSGNGTGTYTASKGGTLEIVSTITGGIFLGPASGGVVQSINGTLISATNEGVLSVPGYSLTLSETINNTGKISVGTASNSAVLYISPGLGDGTATLSGSGSVQLANGYIENQNSSGGLVTLTNQGNTIDGYGAINSNINLINNGTIDGNVNGQTLVVATSVTGTGGLWQAMGALSPYRTGESHRAALSPVRARCCNSLAVTIFRVPRALAARERSISTTAFSRARRPSTRPSHSAAPEPGVAER